MEILIYILGLSWLIVTVMNAEWYKMPDIKPFNCFTCMGFWVGTLFFIYPYPYYAIALGGIVSLVTTLLEIYVYE